MRAALPDRPGALAALAQECGKAGVNIVGLQVFPGVDRVTDELVLSASDGWTEADLRELVERSGGESVVAATCTEAALVDQPTRYVQAARAILTEPASFPDVVAHLFDADVDAGEDVMELAVGDVQVQVRREAPFTAVEHARGAAMAELVSDVLRREMPDVGSASGRMGQGMTPEYAVAGTTVTALIGDEVVGAATVRPSSVDEPDSRTVDLQVDGAWRRRGIGTRLLAEAARLAHTDGAAEIVLTARADNQAVLPMVLAAGMRGRIRMAGDLLTVRIGVRSL
ncbi:MAG: GNAT family N-acetyltransferase [Actinomycetota bacterium]|nr:GNAT family N-acetyltransferase [Actinomycetota bacterium]